MPHTYNNIFYLYSVPQLFASNVLTLILPFIIIVYIYIYIYILNK
jgi:hypothetical protein